MRKLNTTPWRVTVDTNPDQCNLRCTMCDTHSIYNKNRHANIRKQMPKELLLAALKQAVENGVKEVIPSTMGEPLMYPYFEEVFINTLTSSDTKLNLTTNGTFPRKGSEKWGQLLLPVTTDTKISLNGITPTLNEKIMIGANTANALENIKTYLKIRDEVRERSPDHQPTVTLQVTFMKESLSGIEEVIQFAIENKVDRVKGHQLWVTFPQLQLSDLRHPANEGIWNDFVDRIEPYRSQVKLENFSKLGKASQSVPDQYECPFLGNEIWIDHEGNYNVCCAPSDRRASLGSFGTIAERPISKVFGQPSYQSLIENYKTHDLCKNCLLRKPTV